MKRVKLYHDIFYGIRIFGSNVIQENIRILSKHEYMKFAVTLPLKSDLSLLSSLSGRQVLLLLLQNPKLYLSDIIRFLAKFTYFRIFFNPIMLFNIPYAFFSIILESAYDSGHFQLPQFHWFLDHYNKVYLSNVLICTANAKEMRETLPRYFSPAN